MPPNANLNELKDLKLDVLIPFQNHSGQTYEGERLQQLADSIKREGLITPIIVRPTDDDKYEIICGHNRVKAVKLLGYETIKADVRDPLSDTDALGLYFNSNLNQQSFSDWNYSQKIKAVQFYEGLIKDNPQQGKRTDLRTKKTESPDDPTCVQNEHKSGDESKRPKSRDKMAKRMGIATGTYSKFRRIIKLEDDLLTELITLLDARRLSFESVYKISGLKVDEMKAIMVHMKNNTGVKIDVDALKSLATESKKAKKTLAQNKIIKIFVSSDA